MNNTIHSRKAPQSPEQDTFVSICSIPEDEQITIADTGWSEATRKRMMQAGDDDMDMVRAWYS